MRRIILLPLLAAVWLTASSAAAQGIVERFNERFEAARGAMYDKTDYKTAAKEFAAAERVFFKATAAERDTLCKASYTDADHFPDGNFYYDFACALALSGDKRKALDRYETFVDHMIGERECNYEWAAEQDPDLDGIRADERFKAAAARLKEWCDYDDILRKAAPYVRQQCDTLPEWRYAAPNDRELVRVREYFKLDSIAGSKTITKRYCEKPVSFFAKL